MIVRFGGALTLAIVAHLGAYAVIMVSAPDEANIQIQGGSISISLAPSDAVSAEDSEAAGDEAVDPLPEPAPKPPAAPAQTVPVPTPPEPKPKPEPQPEPEPHPEPPLSPEPADAGAPQTTDSRARSQAEPMTPNPLAPTPSVSEHPPIQGREGASAVDAPASESEPSAAISDTQVGNAAEDNYNGALMRHMHRARKFDTDARRSSKISITIDAHGNVLDVRVLRRSGDKTWDRRVVKELKRIAPYPAPPSGGPHTWSFDAVPK